jgi:general secretion pathway protein L
MEAGLMPQILGLDIGEKTIKAVLLSQKGTSGGRVIAFRSLDINACDGIEPAFKKLAQENIFQGIACCLSLPVTDIMFRQVKLPFHDDSKIRRTLPFELEPLIPLPIEDVVTDYLMIPGDGLLVAALAGKSVGEWIKKIEGNLGEVSIIDASPSALAAQVMGKTADGGVILDVGADCTTATFYENGAVAHIRPLAFGGENITKAIAADMSAEREEAERLKITSGHPQTGIKTQEACRQFCAELKNTIEYMKLNGVMQKEPACFNLTGGGSLFAPLRKEIEAFFSCSVNILDIAELKNIEVEASLKNQCAPAIMNTALAAAMRPSAGRKSFNFRRGEFAVSNESFNAKKQFRWAAIVAGIILLLAVINQALDYTLKTRQINTIKKQISLIFIKNFPEAGNINETVQVQYMKTKLEENKKAFGFFESIPEATMADLLKEISSRIPPSLDVVISHLSHENRVILIKGEAKNIDDVSTAKSELEKSALFKDVTIGQTSLAKEGGKVDFNLRIEVK